jgi:hypothetical protein
MTERQPPDVTKQVPQASVIAPPPNQQDQKNPFGNIDWGPRTLERPVSGTAIESARTPQWKVECGIKVIVVNPDIDPKMIVRPEAGAAEPKIRRIAPPPCPERDSR